MYLTGTKSFGNDYHAAEEFADQWAGDNEAYAAVVEVFHDGDPKNAEFRVMDISKAEEFVYHNEAEIQYGANHYPQCICGYNSSGRQDMDDHCVAMARASDPDSHADAHN
jgi:hypothetical protein